MYVGIGRLRADERKRERERERERDLSKSKVFEFSPQGYRRVF